MPTSQTDIVNFALFLIGEQKLNNPVSKTTKTGRLALTVFNQARDKILSLPHDWRHFTTREQLARHTPAPTIGTYDFAYALPNNHIRTIATIDVDGDDKVFQYKREVQGTTQVILTNEECLYLKYIVRLTDTGNWQPWFVEMVYHQIAYMISEPLKQQQEKTVSIYTLLKRSIREGVAANNKEGMDVSASNEDLDRGNADVSQAATLPAGQEARRIAERNT